MIYLRKFENHTAYEAAKSGLILPNVSLCSAEHEVHFNPYILAPPFIDGHEYVDLGLPSGLKWAKMNIGASVETDYGNYYQHSLYIVRTEWGSSWSMPTKAQFEELIANTTYEYMSINGVNGAKFTAQNGNYVFFPAAGILVDNTDPYHVGTLGNYWTSTYSEPLNVYYLSFYNNTPPSLEDFGIETDGVPIRPVAV